MVTPAAAFADEGPWIVEPDSDTVAVADGIVVGAQGWRLALVLLQLVVGAAGPVMIVIRLPVGAFGEGLDGLWLTFSVFMIGVSDFVAVFSSVRASPAGIVVSGVFRTTALPWQSLSGASLEDGTLVLVTRKGAAIPSHNPTEWLRGRGAATSLRAIAAEVTARIQAERARPPDQLPDDPRPEPRRRVVAWVSAALCVGAYLGAIVSTL